VIASFNELLDSTAVTAHNFILKQGAAQVDGIVSYADGVAIFSPKSNLAPNTMYTAEIGPGIDDPAGNVMTTPVVWTFKTASVHDTTTPRVIYTFPNPSDTGVALNINPAATFSEEMDFMSITARTFTLRHDAFEISGRVTFNDETAIFTPATNLAPNTSYTAEVSVDVKNLAGNVMTTPVSWTFTTGSVHDTIAPQVTNTFPHQADSGVALNINPTATFSEAMDSASITNATFTLKQDTTQLSGTVAFSGATVIFTPATNLAPTTTYTAAISVSAKDLAGNSLKNAVTWTFKTEATQ
jgi:hypothetical protein